MQHLSQMAFVSCEAPILEEASIGYIYLLFYAYEVFEEDYT